MLRLPHGHSWPPPTGHQMKIGNLYLTTRAEWAAFILGAREFRSDLTTAYENDPLGDLANAYDCGREFAHWATFRRYDGGAL